MGKELRAPCGCGRGSARCCPEGFGNAGLGPLSPRCQGAAVPCEQNEGKKEGGRAGLLAGALLDAGGQLLHLVVDAAAFGHLLADLLVRMHDRGVVAAAEGLPDPWQ